MDLACLHIPALCHHDLVLLPQFVVPHVVDILLLKLQGLIMHRLHLPLIDLMAQILGESFIISLAHVVLSLNNVADFSIVLLPQLCVPIFKISITLSNRHRQSLLLATGIRIRNILLTGYVTAHALKVLILILHIGCKAGVLLANKCILVGKFLHLSELSRIEAVLILAISLEVYVV